MGTIHKQLRNGLDLSTHVVFHGLVLCGRHHMADGLFGNKSQGKWNFKNPYFLYLRHLNLGLANLKELTNNTSYLSCEEALCPTFKFQAKRFFDFFHLSPLGYETWKNCLLTHLKTLGLFSMPS